MEDATSADPFGGAPPGPPPWARLFRWSALGYGGSGWWLDAALPRSPLGLLLVAFGIPLAWAALGYNLAADRAAYLATHDITCQLWFFPLHVICVRLLGRMWAQGLAPALDGLALDPAAQRRITLGTFGRWASLGALAACLFFIVRDTWFGLVPDASGVIPFDDPKMWDMAALGRPVHVLLLGMWHLEWLLFGYLLWLQIWILYAWTRALRRVDLRDHLDRVLTGGGYRAAFTLLGRTASVSLVFALGNLAFIAATGELIPRDVVHIASVGDFLREMSDLLSTTLLFLLILASVITSTVLLRKAMTRAVHDVFRRAGADALDDLARPLAGTGDATRDMMRVMDRLRAMAGMTRAIVFQREVESVGGSTVGLVVVKAAVPLLSAILKLAKMR